MKLKPTQIVGLVAIVVFGGGMIFRLTQPSERETMEKRLASLPTFTPPPVEIPMPDLSSIQPIPPLDLSAPAAPGASPSEPDYTSMGSQAAKDDLYCAGIVSAEFDAKVKTDPPDEVSKLMGIQKQLDTAGIAKLKAEGVTDGANWATFTQAYVPKTVADYAAKTPRISVADCIARAAKLPPGDLY